MLRPYKFNSINSCPGDWAKHEDLYILVGDHKLSPSCFAPTNLIQLTLVAGIGRSMRIYIFWLGIINCRPHASPLQIQLNIVRLRLLLFFSSRYNSPSSFRYSHRTGGNFFDECFWHVHHPFFLNDSVFQNRCGGNTDCQPTKQRSFDCYHRKIQGVSFGVLLCERESRRANDSYNFG
jgi:hypothetical protein